MSDEKPSPPVRLLVLFQQYCPNSAPDLIVGVPGRAIWAAARFNGSALYKVIDGDGGRIARFDGHSARLKRTALRRPLPAWARYAAGVTLLTEARKLPGADIVICSDEPPGPRGEHSLGMVMAALWHQINALPADEAALFQAAEQARRLYVEPEQNMRS